LQLIIVKSLKPKPIVEEQLDLCCCRSKVDWFVCKPKWSSHV